MAGIGGIHQGDPIGMGDILSASFPHIARKAGMVADEQGAYRPISKMQHFVRLAKGATENENLHARARTDNENELCTLLLSTFRRLAHTQSGSDSPSAGSGKPTLDIAQVFADEQMRIAAHSADRMDSHFALFKASESTSGRNKLAVRLQRLGKKTCGPGDHACSVNTIWMNIFSAWFNASKQETSSLNKKIGTSSGISFSVGGLISVNGMVSSSIKNAFIPFGWFVHSLASYSSGTALSGAAFLVKNSKADVCSAHQQEILDKSYEIVSDAFDVFSSSDDNQNAKKFINSALEKKFKYEVFF
ncbi:MAG: hypothetical protein HC848_03300 [Limnobacter sp.]|nr:hypothetical protein [Limnobacter sp.]